MMSSSPSILLVCFIAVLAKLAVSFTSVNFSPGPSLSKPLAFRHYRQSSRWRASTLSEFTLAGSNGTVFSTGGIKVIGFEDEMFLAGDEYLEIGETIERTDNPVDKLETLETMDEFVDEIDMFETTDKHVDKIEIVEAILTASGDAAAVAEASLPEDVAKELSMDFSAVSEGTEIFSPVTIDDVPTIFSGPEMIPPEIVPPEMIDCKSTTQDKIEAPSTRKIIKFAIPAMCVWLCSPLLSMIDTSAVGRLAGTVHQAALNPAVAVTDYGALCIAFLYAAATNMMASAREAENSVVDKPETAKSMIGVMQLSLYVGAGLGVVMFAFARQFLRAIIGNDAMNPAVFAAAMKYVRIRALGMPAAAVIGSAQASCVGMQDLKSPLYVLFAAALVNSLGDMIFVGSKNPLIGGAAGAAWATVFSQYSAVALFMYWLCKKPKSDEKDVMNLTDAILELTGEPSSEGSSRRKKFRETVVTRLRLLKSVKKEDDTVLGTIPEHGKPSLLRRPLFLRQEKVVSASSDFEVEATKTNVEQYSVRGLLAGRAGMKTLFEPPLKDISKKFVPYILPVTTTSVGRVSGYVAMSHVVSSALGTVNMAAQQILLSVFYCLCPLADSLNLSAQSFVPGIMDKKASKERAFALEQTSMNFIKAGILFGGIATGVVGLTPFLSRFFTSDPAVISLVNMAVPYLAMFFSVHGFMCASEGILLGKKDLSFLGKMYGGFFIAIPYFMLRVKRAALSGVPTVNLNSVWQVFLGYQLFRSVAWLWRLAILRKRAYREASAVELKP